MFLLSRSKLLLPIVRPPIRTSASIGEFHKQNHRWDPPSRALSAIAVGAAVIAGYSWNRRQGLRAEASALRTAGERRKDLPKFSSKQVSEHNSVDKRVWITFKHGVYDITDFIPQHPGADQLLLAAGASVEPFWNLYAVHLDNEQVYSLLERYRIGNLDERDVEKDSGDVNDPFADDPQRHSVLSALSAKPFNAEPPLTLVADSFLTPNALFYVRNHLPVPKLDPASYELEVEGLGVKKPLRLNLRELKNEYRKTTIVSAVQCGGNRRTEMNEKKPLKGLGWRGAAIGNAAWTGVKLSDVLKSAGFNIPADQAHKYHVQFEGYDTGADGSPYGASVPLSKALEGDILLAYEMNGAELPRDHGYPIRAVVPGTVGARSVKWLAKIVISKEESDSHWQRKDYKGFNPSVDWDTADFEKAPSIQAMPVTSAICKPAQGQKIVPGKNMTVPAKGYAWSGGGARIIRIDLTSDGGKTWVEGRIIAQDTRLEPRHYGWTLWEADVPVKKGQKEAEIWCKAVDSNYNVQPESFENIWNLRGLLSNAYPRVKVKLQ